MALDVPHDRNTQTTLQGSLPQRQGLRIGFGRIHAKIYRSEIFVPCFESLKMLILPEDEPFLLAFAQAKTR